MNPSRQSWPDQDDGEADERNVGSGWDRSRQSRGVARGPAGPPGAPPPNGRTPGTRPSAEAIPASSLGQRRGAISSAREYARLIAQGGHGSPERTAIVRAIRESAARPAQHRHSEPSQRLRGEEDELGAGRVPVSARTGGDGAVPAGSSTRQAGTASQGRVPAGPSPGAVTRNRGGPRPPPPAAATAARAPSASGNYADRLEAPLPGNASYNLNFRDPNNESDEWSDDDMEDADGNLVPALLSTEWEAYWSVAERGAGAGDLEAEGWTYERLLQLDEHVVQRGGLATAAVRALARVTISNSPDAARQADCSICLERFLWSDKLVQLPCAHCFHEDCVVPWFKSHHKCPICRLNMKDGTDEASRDPGAASDEEIVVE